MYVQSPQEGEFSGLKQLEKKVSSVSCIKVWALVFLRSSGSRDCKQCKYLKSNFLLDKETYGPSDLYQKVIFHVIHSK